ncbi:putative ABC transport system permease protein [Anaerobacterium chartisolvens]|uniref:Putative ABC transport system permease protein n=1 Tax=Anaerobacterium chartisolvens TaxID=1297424 RepID=A0A369BB38_9FIRM|nr:ABC transporter permease [Anaerobacterium chartisolvens]RCX18749.1 putative ABC transport system permease protein [Anaerobacterium chartisolvens]
MNLSMVKKDLLRNKAINITLLLFIVLSAALMSIGTMIVIQVFESIDTMYKIARPPHFMQMHMGDAELGQINDFAEGIDYVEDWQDIEMLNVYGGNIWIKKPDGTSFSMINSLLDLGFIKQSEKYDLLLNMDNKPIYPSKGEIGVPIILLDSYDIDIGDTITIKDGDFSMSFTVTSYVRDSQMNSTMCSSTRFLVNEREHEILKENTGKIEHLIEFYLKDLSQEMKFQTAYENAGLPANGPAITYTAIRLVSGLPDIMMVVVIILVSFFLIFIVCLCLRFTILTAMEEEIKSIGTMRAIGISFRDIRKLYMIKYRALAIAGCIIGYVISIFANRLFLSNITKTFGSPQTGAATVIIPIFAVCIVYMLEMHFSKRIMKKIKRISVVEALISSEGNDKIKISRAVRCLGLQRVKRLPVNLFMGVRDIMAKGKIYFMLFFIMLVTTSIMVVPMNLLNTFKSPQFINYMGKSISDIVISVSTAESLTDKYDKTVEILSGDADVANYSIEARTVYEAVNKDGEWININVDCSDKANEELRYISGNMPVNENEIAISVMNANELGASAGKTLKMRMGGQQTEVIVSGIYQDVTSGGYTAKMTGDYDKKAVKEYSFSVNLKDGVNAGQKVDQYHEAMGVDVEVMDMEEFARQTVGGVTRQLSKAVLAVAAMVACFVALFIILYLKLQIVKEYSHIAISKAIGFTVLDIRKQYLIKTCLVSLIGILVGTLFANTLGEGIVSGIIGIVGIGISKISFVINPVEAYLFCPLIILIIVVSMTWYCSAVFKNYNIIRLINE